MKKNRLLALLLAAVMTVSTTATAFAADGVEEPTTPPTSGTANPGNKEEPGTPDPDDKKEPDAPEKEEPAAPEGTKPDDTVTEPGKEPSAPEQGEPEAPKAFEISEFGFKRKAADANAYLKVEDCSDDTFYLKFSGNIGSDQNHHYWVEVVGEKDTYPVAGCEGGSDMTLLYWSPKSGHQAMAGLEVKDGDKFAAYIYTYPLDTHTSGPDDKPSDDKLTLVNKVDLVIEAEPVTEYGDLDKAIKNPDCALIRLGADIPLEAKLNINRAVTIDGAKEDGGVYTLDGTSLGAARAAGEAPVAISATGVTLQNLKITAAAGKAALDITADTTLENVEVESIVISGADVTLKGSAVENVTLMLGQDGTTEPALTVGADSTVTTVTVDDALKDAIAAADPTKDAEAIAKDLVTNNGTGDISVVVGDKTVTIEKPATPPAPGSDGSSNDHDYFGTATWDEVKDKIADAKDGDTIKISGNGLKNFPASVARELKGKDITVEIRKNGVTYSINGLKIGSVDKLWYEFENLEGQLLTVSSSKPANKPQNSNTVKPNPSTGR